MAEILLIEPNPWPQTVLHRQLSQFGRVTVQEKRPGQALQIFPSCDLVVLSGDALGSSGDGLEVLNAPGACPAILLTRHPLLVPPIDGVVVIPYRDVGSLFLPTVRMLLKTSSTEEFTLGK